MMSTEYACGLGACKPTWMLRFATTKWFLVVYGLLGTLQTTCYIYFIATLTTLEKRFRIPSTSSGIVMSGNEISQILLSLILTYYGGRGNRPLWIAWGVAAAAISCFILAMPHFIYGPGQDAIDLTRENGNFLVLNSTLQDTVVPELTSICNVNVGNGSTITVPKKPCDLDDNSTTPLLLIFISQFVLGIGTSLYYCLGQTYMDDNTKKTNTPQLLGLTLALRMFGPALGFQFAYFCLRLYIDPTLTPMIDYTDPRWLGAWWLGWIILGMLMLTLAMLVAMFPHSLPKKRIVVKEQAQPFMDPIEGNTNQTTSDIKDFYESVKRLLKNKILMCNVTGSVFYVLGASGFMTFIPRYIEIQFKRSAAIASGVIGTASVAAMAFGFFIAGLIISKLKPSAKKVMMWNVFVGIVYVIGEVIFLCLQCGGDMHGMMPDGKLTLNATCNSDCNCGNARYEPVCSEDKLTAFYSPCHAGCTATLQSNGTMIYTNCSCVVPNISSPFSDKQWPMWGSSSSMQGETLMVGDELGNVMSGPCDEGCTTRFIIFLTVATVMNLLSSTGKLGNILVNYRCVETHDKSMAQGLSLLMISLFAFIPGPIIYGAIIDSACLMWSGYCGGKGNCLIYDANKFRIYLNSTAIGFTVVGIALDVVVLQLGKGLNLYASPDEIEETSGRRKSQT